MSEQEDTTQYKVVLNHEEQYSIWPAERENALGWRDDGFRGAKAEVLAYIKEHWTDMRPLSLRQLMDNAQQPTTTAPVSSPTILPSNDAVGIPSDAATTVVNEPVSVTASATPEASPTTLPDAAKERRGWFGRRRNDQGKAEDTALPVSAGNNADDAANATQQRRGLFGKRNNP